MVSEKLKLPEEKSMAIISACSMPSSLSSVASMTSNTWAALFMTSTLPKIIKENISSMSMIGSSILPLYIRLFHSSGFQKRLKQSDMMLSIMLDFLQMCI